MGERLVAIAARRPGALLAALAAITLGAALYGGSVERRLDPYGYDVPGSESARVVDELRHRVGVSPEHSVVALVRGGRPRSSRALRTRSLRTRALRTRSLRTRALRTERLLRRDPAVRAVTGYRGTGDRGFVSRDGRSTYLVASLRPLEGRAEERAVNRLLGRAKRIPGVQLGGPSVFVTQATAISRGDVSRAELVAFPILALLALWFFRGVVAAALPLLVGAVAIEITSALLRVVTTVTPISVFSLSIVTGLGLGLAIDYSLLVISRYREELANERDLALRRTLASAGPTVLFSSATVAAALASLLVFPQRLLSSMGIGGALVAVVAGVSALVVLTPLLALLGPRVNALSPAWLRRAADQDARPDAEGFWYRLARFVSRRALPVAVACTVVLVALGLPFTRISFTAAQAQLLPSDRSARQVDTALRKHFPTGHSTPLYVLVRRSPKDTQKAVRRLRRLPGVHGVGRPSPAGRGRSLVPVYGEAPALSAAGQDLVRRVRNLRAGPPLEVTGEAATLVDRLDSFRSNLPLALGLILTATLVVLFLMTGSLVLPFKAFLMNLLTLSAVFGSLVLVFQDGRLEGLLGYHGEGAIDATQPILLFAIAFALSTDYGIVVLSRIREAREAGADDREAVALGLQRTGRIVTSAALLVCVALGAVATSQLIYVKELGVGIGLAVLLDATLMRALLMPSLMTLLGRANWWAPGFLRSLHGRVGLAELHRGAGPPPLIEGGK
jgi:uncharacterized membrane protein YdfJ with MMPL/SSD domain